MHTVITGATGALGRHVVALLSDAGHTVTAIVRADAIDSVDGLASGCTGVDLTEPAAVEAAIQQLVAACGPIGGLVNIAGGFAWETVTDGSVDTWDRMFAMNVRTAFNCCHSALPRLAAGASIVNVGAGAALKAGAGMGAYAASKSGVHRLTEALAEELRDRGARVNAIMPSVIDTAANRKAMPDADFTKWVTPEEIGRVIAFLLSTEASGITGALIPVPGRV